jgi:hypothetical protein
MYNYVWAIKNNYLDLLLYYLVHYVVIKYQDKYYIRKFYK